ncbi:hypothetical protein Tco_0545937 [Tanacetum coccineum]
MKSVLAQSALNVLCEKFHIPDVVHPELPGRNDRICNSHVEIYLFAFINHVDPTNVQIGEREVTEGEDLLLQLTRGRIVPLAGVNDQGNVNVQGTGNDDVNEKDGDAAKADHTKQVRKNRKTADGASGSGLPPKKLKEDYGTSGIGASTGGKSVATLLSFLEGNTLAVDVGVTEAATVSFVTSSVTPIPKREGPSDSISRTDDEVASIVRSSVPPPPVLPTAVATTIVAGATSALVHESGIRHAQPSIFRDSASPNTAEANVAGPSQPAGVEVSTNTFFVSQDMDSETLHQVYVTRWNVINEYALDDPDVFCNLVDQLAPPLLFSQLRSMDYEQLFTEFNVRVARQTCLGAEVRMRLEHEIRGSKRFEGKCAIQDGWLKEKDAKLASLKAQPSLKEAEAVEAIRLRSQVVVVEAAEAARASELNALKEQNAVLEGQVTALESAAVRKDVELASSNAQIAKVTQDLSNLQLSYDELSIKATTHKSKKDKLIDQASTLEGTCSGLRDEVAGLDADLMETALHLDEEFYPRYLTTIAGRRWILGHGLKLAVMKCLQSPKYLVALRGAIGRAINKDM